MPQHPVIINRREKFFKKRAKDKKSWESKDSIENDHGKFYRSKVWRILRNFKISNDTCCEYHDFFFPEDKGIVIHAVEIDHYRSITDRPDLALDYDNLRSTCFKCHRKKTILDKITVRFAKDFDSDLYGIDKQNKLDDFNNSIKKQ